jgi:hypothetical protein
MALDWWLPHGSPAEFVAIVNLSDDSAWLLRHNEFMRLAQQKKSAKGLHLYFYVEGRSVHQVGGFQRFELEKRAKQLFRLAR